MLSNLSDFFLSPRAPLWPARMGLLLLSVALSAIGVLFVHSTTAGELEAFPSQDALRQIIKIGIGIALLLAVIALDYRLLERTAYAFYTFLICVLAALLAVKHVAGESIARWIHLGFFNVQPSELMKLGAILALARYLRFRSDQRSIGGLFRIFALTLVPMVLVVAQPDLGTGLMLPPILLALLYVAGARRSHLAAALVAGLLMFPAMIAIHEFLPRDISERIVKPYQVERLKAYLQRDHHSRLDNGYQLRQSIIAFGSGGITGKGYQEGTQNRLKLLPARHTDFIFAIIGEEWGLAGTGAVLSIYVTLVLLCFRVAVRTREPFARLVATGVAVLFAAQGFENFGMTLGLTPITGIPLPFVSFGGSSLVTSFLAVGLVLSIAYRPVRVVASQDLNPRDEEEVLYVIDEHPAGAIPFPEK